MDIFIDIDGVVADLHSEWLRLYNQDYNDCLSIDDITDWEMDRFVKPECGNRIYTDYLIPSIYDNVSVLGDALHGIWSIKNLLGHRIIFASSGIPTADAKFKWLQRNGFDPGEWGRDYIVVHDKSLLRGDLLIDDRDKNVLNFDGKYILFDAPYNKGFFSAVHRTNNWKEIFHIVKGLS